jgi:hypothetical protein
MRTTQGEQRRVMMDGHFRSSEARLGGLSILDAARDDS